MNTAQQSQGQAVARLIGSIALGAGALLPWVQNVLPGDQVRFLIAIPGMPAGPRQLSIVLIGVAVGVALMTLLFGNGVKTAFVTLVGGGVAVATAAEFLWTFSSMFGRSEPAIGVYVTLGTGVLLVVSGGVRLLPLDEGIANAIARRTQG